MLQIEVPETNENPEIQVAYEFLLTYMEATSKEITSMVSNNQQLLRKILEASKISEQTLDKLFDIEKQKVLHLLLYHHAASMLLSIYRIRLPVRVLLCPLLAPY